MDIGKLPAQYVHREWQTDNGLPQSTVLTLAQTPDGFLWLGTQEGLARFDGVRFEVFDTASKKELRSDYISALLVGREGELWIGTRGGGVSRLQDGVFTTLTAADGLSSNAVRCLALDGEGGVWAGTNDGRLNRVSNGRIEVLARSDGLPGEPLTCLLPDHAGDLWIGTLGGGLVRLRGRHLATYSTGNGLASDRILSLCEDAGGELLVGSDGGVDRLRGDRFEPVDTSPGSKRHVIRALLAGRDGSVWIATEDGLDLMHEGTVESFVAADALSHNRVLSLLEDREGDLWVGTLVGLHQFVRGKFKLLSTREGLPHEFVWCVEEGRENDLWVGTGGGLARFGSGGVKRYGRRDGLPRDEIIAVHEDRHGALWIATWNGGLSRLADGHVSTLTAANGLASDLVEGIEEDEQGRLWIRTDKGLNCWHDGVFDLYTVRDGLSSDNVTCLLAGGDGSLWVGTAGGGLDHLKDGVLTRFGPAQGLTSHAVTAIFEDSRKAVWVATLGGGLGMVAGGRIVSCREKDGLFDNTIFCILDDRQGRLWLSSNHGIASVNRDELEAFFAGRESRVECTVYGTADGMRSAECNGGGSPAGWKTRDGRLLFPTIRGLVVVDPDRIGTNPVRPPVHVEHALVDGVAVDPQQGARLGPGLRRLDIQFTALSLQAPEKVRFRFRLHGFEERFVDAGNRRDASFTNLAPGAYRFEVIACNNDGVWNTAGASWAFVVMPFFYQRPAFLVACALLVGALALGVYRVRMAQLRARNAVLVERNRIAREVHDTVAQGLAGIILHLENAEGVFASQPDRALRLIARARDLVRDSLDETRRAIAALRPKPLEHGGLLDALGLLVRSMRTDDGPEVSLLVDGRPRRLHPEMEHDLWHIVQEAVTNAIRHSQGRHIRVAVHYRRMVLRLIVSDDGIGFTAPGGGASSEGFGLASMRQWAQRWHWDMEVTSEPGRGTEVRVDVPLRGRFFGRAV